MDLNNTGLDDAEQVNVDPSAEPAQQPDATAEVAMVVPEEVSVPAPVPAAVEDAHTPAQVIVEEPAPPPEPESAPDEASIPEMEPAPADVTADETPAPVSAAPETPTSPFKRGDLVEATIVSTSPLQVVVDLGSEVQAVISSGELEKMSRQTLEMLKPGEPLSVYVVTPRDHNGNAVVSLNRAQEELDWQKAEEYRKSQAPYETRVAGYNKGGLIVRFGRVRGFVPQSQLSTERRRGDEGESMEERWSKMVNEAIVVKVMEVDRSRNRLILSERMASREVREKRKEALVNELNVGEVRVGRVVSLEDFGAFVDVGGAEGLVHLTEITWQHITHPRDLLKVGQEVKVEVISIDRELKRIGLSIKRQSPDPWDAIALQFEIGQLVQGIVTKLTKFGAFVQLVDVPEIEGLVHISELSERRVTSPREVVNDGDKLTLRVVKIDVKERRLGLSLKKVNSAEYLDRDMDRNWGGPDSN
jgi:small subunit ribosomal protein S1